MHQHIHKHSKVLRTHQAAYALTSLHSARRSGRLQHHTTSTSSDDTRHDDMTIQYIKHEAFHVASSKQRHDPHQEQRIIRYIDRYGIDTVLSEEDKHSLCMQAITNNRGNLLIRLHHRGLPLNAHSRIGETVLDKVFMRHSACSMYDPPYHIAQLCIHNNIPLTLGILTKRNGIKNVIKFCEEYPELGSRIHMPYHIYGKLPEQLRNLMAYMQQVRNHNGTHY